MRSFSVYYLFRKHPVRAVLGVECLFLSGWKPSVTETLNHYSLTEMELYYFTGYLLEQQNHFSSTWACQRERGWGWERESERQKGRVSEFLKFPRGLSIPELSTLMKEQNLPVSLELEHTHNNSPVLYEERGAGGLQFASPLPQSLAFSRAFLIQRKHPWQNKTSAICSISPCFPPQSRWLSTGACSTSSEHWSISASNQNINWIWKLLTSCRRPVLCLDSL